MPKYLSGRVKRTPQGSLTTDRYQYLGLEQAEPNLGDPPELDAVPSGTQYQIISLIDRPGERFWVPVGGGIIPGSITVREEGLIIPRTDANPNLGITSITDINFVGSVVTAVGTINNDGSPGTAVTVTISPPGDNNGVLFNNDGEFAASPFFTFDNTTGIGSVGIGTSTPTQNLHVVGNVKLDKTIYGEDNQPGDTGNLLVKTATGGVKWASSGSVTSGAGGTITQIQFHDNTGLVGGASNFVFDSTNSRIGIGSTQPDRLLDVLGDSRFTGVTTFAGITTVSGSTLFTKQLNVAGVSTFNDDVIFAGDNHNITFDKSIDDLIFDDNAKLTFGIGNTTVNLFYKPDTRDFRHEFIGGANYVLLTKTFDLKNVDASKAAITAFDPGGVPEVRLFNDGNEKLRTTGYGVTVFGQLETTDIFASGDVGIGTTNPTASNIESALENNTKVLAVGILTANQIFGNITSIQETLDLETLNVTGVTSTKNLLVTGIATFDQGVSIGGTLTYEDVTNVDSVGIITARQGIDVSTGGINVQAGVATFAGITTVTGSTLFAKQLNVAGVSTFNNDIVIGVGATVGFGTTAYFRDNAKLVFGDEGDLEIGHIGNQNIIEDKANGALILRTNGSSISLQRDTGATMLSAVPEKDVRLYFNGLEKFGTSGVGASVYGQLDVTEKVGIGTTIVDGKLHVSKGSAGNVNADSDANNIVIESNTDPGISFLSPNDEQARIKFADPDDTDVGAITYDHASDTLSLIAGGTTVIGIGSTNTTIEGNLDVNGNITYSTMADVNSVGVITAQSGINVTGAGVSVVGVSTFFDDLHILGSVGIGTTNPTQKLEVYDGRILVRNITDDAAKIVLRDDSGSYNHYQIRNQDGNFKIRNSGASPQYDAMNITSDGNLGIGTNSAYAKLEVGVGSETNSDTEYYGQDFAIAIRANRGNNGGDEGNGIVFIQKWDATNTNLVRTGAILGYKQSGTGNFGGGLIFKTQEHGANPMSEKLRITSNGDVSIASSGKLTIQPNPNSIFGVSEAIRIDQNNATDDRALQVFEFENSSARHHAITHNLRVYRYSASAYGYTQGKYSGSQMHEYAGGTYKIFTNPQASVGNTQDIVPTERFRLTQDGNVGIGTNNPTGSSAIVNNNATLAVGILTARQIFGTSIVPDGDLLVDGNLKVTGISTFVGVTTFGNVGIGGSLPDDFVTNKFVVGDGGGSRGMTIYSDGTLGQIYFADGNSGDDRTRGGIVYDHSVNELKFSVNAVEKFIIDSDGDVGIGTDDPTSKFDVHMNDKSGVNFLNISNNSAIDLKANEVESCGRIQVSESNSGGVMILSTKNTSGDITERLRINTNGDVTTTGADTFDIANAGFTARKSDSVSITRASGTPLEINRTGDDGELIKFYQDGAERANISIAGTDLIFGNTTERFRINSTGAKVTGNLVVDGTLTYEDVTNVETVGIITTSGGIDVTGGGIDVTNSSGIRVSGVSTFNDNVNFQDRVLVGRDRGTIAKAGVVGHADHQIQVVGTGDSCGISIIRYSNDGTPGSLTFAKSKSPTIGTNTAVQGGDELGEIRFNGAHSGQNDDPGDLANSGARIRAKVTGTVDAYAVGDMPTSLIFDTSDDGTALLVERMRIRHNGLIGMGGTDRASGNNSQYSRLIVCGNNDSTSGYGVLTIQAQSSVLHQSTIGTLVFADRRGDFANITAFTDATTGGSDFPGRLSFATTPDGATVPTNKLTILSGGNVGIGSEIPQYKLEVAGTVAATNFDSLSDRKVKTNIQIIQDPIEKIKKIDGVSFNWKSDNKPSLGVIADNVQSVLPEIVSNNDPKSVNYNGLIGLLIEAVKDQQKQIEELRGLIDK